MGSPPGKVVWRALIVLGRGVAAGVRGDGQRERNGDHGQTIDGSAAGPAVQDGKIVSSCHLPDRQIGVVTMRILGDWGSTHLRLWLCDGSRVVDHAEGPGAATPGLAFASILAERIGPWLKRAGGEAVLLCGMVGARTGWIEAPYCGCPVAVGGWREAAVEIRLDGTSVRIAPGLKGRNFADDPDVMRGEETQMFGAMALRPELAIGDALIVLPGTHSKWARVEDGVITSFHTVMTGELYALLATHSALVNLPGDAGDPGDGFAAGVAAAARQPVNTALFAARSRQLLDGRGRAWARDYLSGLLIGGELNVMLGLSAVSAITLVGDGALLARYGKAADHLGLSSRSLDGEACAIAGLLALSGGES